MILPDHIRRPDPTIYDSDNFVVFDFETTNKRKGSALEADNSTVAVSWAVGPTGPINYLEGNEFELHEFVDALHAADFVVAHNAKFDLQWAARCGADLTQLVVWDTMLAEYVLLGNQMKPLSLSAVARRYKYKPKDAIGSALIGAGVCPSEIPSSILQKYAIRDTQLTRKIFKKQKVAFARSLTAVLFTRCLLTPVLADIELNGMCLDHDRVQATYRAELQKVQELTARLDEITGGINLRSAKQRAEFLYEQLGFAIPADSRGNPLLTAQGQPKTDSGTLSMLKAKTKKQSEFLALYREVSKAQAALSKNLDFFKGVVEEQDGVFHAILNQARTRTHRLSSTGWATKFEQFDKDKSVQFQNLPRSLKNLFRSRHKGWLFCEADGAQLEFRVAAFLGDDAVARKGIIDGEDVHALTAEVLGVSRQEAKPETFRPLYGGSGDTPARRKYCEAFRDKYSDIAAEQERWTYEVLRTKRLVTPWGLVYYWPDVKASRDGYINYTTSIYNYPVQALATAEIIPIAVVYVWHRMKALGMEGFLVNTIHDSILAEIPPNEAELFKEVVVQGLTSDVYEYLETVYGMRFDVPLGVGLKMGTFWTEAEEEKIVPPNPFLAERGSK